MARNFNTRDKALTASIREGQGKIFSEDRERLESQQKNLLAWPQRTLLKLNIDVGGVKARQALDRLITAEQAGNLIAQQAQPCRLAIADSEALPPL